MAGLRREKSLLILACVHAFGAAGIVSDVLSGKRELNKDHIKRLSRRFLVSPEAFF